MTADIASITQQLEKDHSDIDWIALAKACAEKIEPSYEVLPNGFVKTDPGLMELAQHCADRSGPMPEYSGLTQRMIQDTKMFNESAAALCWAKKNGVSKDPNDQIMVVLGKRQGPDGNDLYNLTGGGFLEGKGVDEEGEQHDACAARELSEEVVDDQNVPILSAVTKDRMKLFKSGIDYRSTARPTGYAIHSAELTLPELAAMQGHVDKIDSDPVYKEAVNVHTKREVTGFAVMSLAEALQLDASQFAHPQEFAALHEFAQGQQRARGSVNR